MGCLSFGLRGVVSPVGQYEKKRQKVPSPRNLPPVPMGYSLRTFRRSPTMNHRPAATAIALSALLAGGVSLAAARPEAPPKAQPPAAPAADTAYQQEIEALRKDRNEGLKQEDGWFTLVGLFWLEPGENRFGSGPDNRVIFPEGRAPAFAGTLIREGDAVKVRVAPGVTVTSGGQPVTEAALTSDAQGKPTMLEIGSLSFFVIQRGDKVGV